MLSGRLGRVLLRRRSMLAAGLAACALLISIGGASRGQKLGEGQPLQGARTRTVRILRLPSAPPRPQITQANWPAEGTVTVLVRFGLTDTERTDWSGQMRIEGGMIARLRPWRFGAKMEFKPGELAL